MTMAVKPRHPEVICFRLSKDEKRAFDMLITNSRTTKSEYLRKKVKRILKTVSTKL